MKSPLSTASSSLTPIPVRVSEFHAETHDVFTLTLEPPHTQGFAFQPGQFNILYAFGVGEAAISLSGDPGDHTSIVHTIRAVGSVTKALAKLRPGDTVGVRGPYGSAWPMDAARGKEVVIVTGGIGLAPLRPVLRYLQNHRSDYGRIFLLHGIRTPADHLFPEDLQTWSGLPDGTVHVAATQADRSWTGHVGVVTTLFPRIEFDPNNTVGFICGPDVMIRYAVREFEQRGITGDRIYVSLERNMQCAIGYCGHCQFGPKFICMDGPVFRHDTIRDILEVREA